MVYNVKEEQMQLEMFPSALRRMPIKKRGEDNLYRNRLPLEKIIIFSISFIITAVIFFSLGVEKGRHMVKVNITNHIAPIKTVPIDTKLQKTETLIEKKEQPQQKISPDIQKMPPLKIFPAKGTYTIQVATYRKTVHAQNAIDRLKEKGFRIFILPADKFVQLCVGKFMNQEEAKPVLKELRKNYADCFIRRI